MKIFTVKSNCRLSLFTDNVYPQASFCFNALLRGKDIKVNGVRVGKDIELFAGDEVVYYTSPERESVDSHIKVFEDNNILVCDKYSGVSSEGLFSELSGKGETYAVHRLDRNTQGIIVFAKNKIAEEELLSAFREHRTIKTYLALCKNNFKDKHKVLTAYLVKDAAKSEVKVFSSEKKGSVKIITEYDLLEERGDIALVRLTLHTGRTHQIRAHMAFEGCPVLGDGKYGDSALNKKYGVKRQCLVSKTLEFKFADKLKYLNGRQFVSAFEPSEVK